MGNGKEGWTFPRFLDDWSGSFLCIVCMFSPMSMWVWVLWLTATVHKHVSKSTGFTKLKISRIHYSTLTARITICCGSPNRSSPRKVIDKILKLFFITVSECSFVQFSTVNVHLNTKASVLLISKSIVVLVFFN